MSRLRNWLINMTIWRSSWQKTWVEMSENGPRRMDSHPRGLCNGKPSRINKASALVHFTCSSFSLYKWGVCDHCVTGQRCPSHHCCAQTGWAFQQSSLSLLNSSSHHVSLAWSPLYGHSLVRYPFAKFLATSTQKKWGCSPSGSLDHHYNKRTHIDSQELSSVTWPLLFPEFQLRGNRPAR